MNNCSKFFSGALVSFMIMTGVQSKEIPNLVDMAIYCPDIALDIRYASENNFTGKKVYPNAKCYLLKSTADKLKKVQAELAEKGLGLKIYDGFRFQRAQEIFWEICPNEGYVANPQKGSRHNRGCTVDVTLIDLKTGKELVMPTEFDDFTVKAHRDCMDLPQEAIKNRQLLEDVMHKHGFVGLPTEWWHFDDANWQNYPLLRDVTFEDLEK